MITRNNSDFVFRNNLRLERNLQRQRLMHSATSEENILGQKKYKPMTSQTSAMRGRHPNLVKSNQNVTGTEVGALLSADMRDEAYYRQKTQDSEAMKSPRYRGFVEHEMEKSRSPRVGPIGVPDQQATRKPQSLTAGRPVRPKDETSIANHDELLYLGEESKVQKPPNHANMARQRVQQKTSTELLRMEKDQQAVKTYLNQYEKEKAYKSTQKHQERQQDMEMLKTYNPFGKPGGGAPMKTTSGRNLPKMSNDFEIRFRDDGYHKKMVDTNFRYKNPEPVQKDYKEELNQQVQERSKKTQESQERDREQEQMAMRYDPYGKPGGGAPRPQDVRSHWSKLEPGQSTTSLTEKQKRLQLQQNYNIGQAERTRSHRRMRQLKNDPVYNPWGKGAGNPRFDDAGNVSVRFGMKTHYDVFNQEKLISTHSGATLGGWPLPTADSTAVGDAGLHTANSLYSEPRRKGLLSKRHGATFVTEPGESQPPLLNGKEAEITDAGSKPKTPTLRRQGALNKLHDQALVAPLHKTDHETKASHPSAGTLKRELADSNKILNLKVNEGHKELKSPREARGDNARQSQKGSGTVLGGSVERKSSVQFDEKANREYIQSQAKSSPAGAGLASSSRSNADVADWMRSKAVCQPQRDTISGLIQPTRRCTSDVTRHRLDIRQPHDARAYHDELSRQVADRKRRESYDRRVERQAENNWDTNLFRNFGQPGGGAPSSRGTARRQFSNPSLVPTKQLGTSVPKGPEASQNINSHIGGPGHGAPHDKGSQRRAFSNAALLAQQQTGTTANITAATKPTTVASLLMTHQPRSGNILI